MNRKKWILLGSLFVIICLVMIWPLRFPPKFVKSKEICFVVKDLGQEYWDVVRKGAFSASKEFQVPLLFYWVGSDSDAKGQIAFLDQALKKRVQAVVLASCDLNATVPMIRKLTQAGIPVITIDSRVNSTLPVSLISTHNVRAGDKAAKILADIINGQGEVAIISHVPGTATAIDREEGFRDALKKYPGITIVSTRFSYGDPDRAETVATDILDNYPNLKGILAVNEPAAVGAAQALVNAKKDKTVKLVGFDSSVAEISYLESGVINATIVQNPFTMGYLGVRSAVTVLHHQMIPSWIDTGATVITRDNMFTEENQKLLFPFDLK